MPRQFKAARKMNKLKLLEAAEKLGVSQPTLSSWESGRKSPTLDKLESMSHLYGVTTDFLLGLTSNKVLPDTELVPADNYIVMHGKPVWSKKYGWMIVDAVNKVMIQDQDTSVPFEEMQEIYYRAPLFSEGPVPTDAPLRKDELYTSKEVWVEPISADDKLRSELRGWYTLKQYYAENEHGNKFYLDTYGAKWLAFTDLNQEQL